MIVDRRNGFSGGPFPCRPPIGQTKGPASVVVWPGLAAEVAGADEGDEPSASGPHLRPGFPVEVDDGERRGRELCGQLAGRLPVGGADQGKCRRLDRRVVADHEEALGAAAMGGNRLAVVAARLVEVVGNRDVDFAGEAGGVRPASRASAAPASRGCGRAGDRAPRSSSPSARRHGDRGVPVAGRGRACPARPMTTSHV